MKLSIIALMTALALLIPVGIATKGMVSNSQPESTVTSQSNTTSMSMPPAEVLTEDKPAIKPRPASKTIVLESRNVVSLRGPVTEESVAKMMSQLQEMSLSLPKSSDIYLVLDTPGGEVEAGLELIDFVQAMPQRVNTITLFAASMGFQIVQNLNTRFITNQGTLMSHRAKLGGFGGQLDGEFESRYKMIKRKITYMDVVASDRMGMSLDDYKKLIKDEYWVHGFDSVQEKAADEVINAACGESMSGSVNENIQTMFGAVKVKFSKCPLIRGPLSVDMSNVLPENRAELKAVIAELLNNKEVYVKDYILTDKHFKYFHK